MAYVSIFDQKLSFSPLRNVNMYFVSVWNEKKTGSELPTRWTHKYWWNFFKHVILPVIWWWWWWWRELSFEQLYCIFFLGLGYICIRIRETRRRQLIRCRHHTRACVCELTVTVFASDIEKMGCVCAQLCNVSIFLSDMCLPVWTFGWYWFMFE